MVLGAEDGKNPVNFEQWLIPFESIVSALKIKTTALNKGQIERRSPEIVTRLSEQQLQKNKELGAVLSVADIRRLLHVEVSFDMAQYALVLTSSAPAVAMNGIASTEKSHFFCGAGYH